jgi:transposase
MMGQNRKGQDSGGKRFRQARRTYSDEFKSEAVQMMLDGSSAQTVANNLGISHTNLLYRWKEKLLKESGPAATSLDGRVRQLEEALRRVERERDILKKALAIFSQS